MKKRNLLTSLILTISLAASLTACGSQGSAAAAAQTPADTGEAAADSAENEGQAEGGSEAEAPAERVSLTIGVTGAMYDDIWAPAIARLADEGIDVELVQFSDYTLPNNALNNKETDLNAFQHSIYLNNENEEYGYELSPLAYTFVIPLNLYSQKVSSVDEIKDGDIIAIPDDLPNQGRGLKVLEAAGLIKLKSDADFSPTLDDIEEYNVNIELEELKGNTIPSALPDVTAAIINGNFGLDFGLDPDTAIYKDDVLPREYWNLIVSRTEDLSDPDKVALYQKVIDAFQTEETEKVFNDTFGGYFVKVGWDEDLIADYK